MGEDVRVATRFKPAHRACATFAMDTILVTVKLFSIYQEAYGVPEVQWEFPSQSSVQAVLDRALADHPCLEPWRNQTRLGLNLQFVDANTPLSSGDEVVLIPPVSGG